MAEKDLREEILSSKKKLLSLRIKRSSGDLKDNSVFKKTKKRIARLFTKINNKQG
jgi:ribosomal protein L29